MSFRIAKQRSKCSFTKGFGSPNCGIQQHTTLTWRLFTQNQCCSHQWRLLMGRQPWRSPCRWWGRPRRWDCPSSRRSAWRQSSWSASWLLVVSSGQLAGLWVWRRLMTLTSSTDTERTNRGRVVGHTSSVAKSAKTVKTRGCLNSLQARLSGASWKSGFSPKKKAANAPCKFLCQKEAT